jgi:hypothetical protein
MPNAAPFAIRAHRAVQSVSGNPLFKLLRSRPPSKSCKRIKTQSRVVGQSDALPKKPSHYAGWPIHVRLTGRAALKRGR